MKGETKMLFAKRNILCLCLAMLFAIGTPIAAKAMSLGLSPASQSVSLGSSALVDVWLKQPGGSALGEYTVFLNYDPAILAYGTTTFSAALGGDPANPMNWFDTVSLTPGSLMITGFPYPFDPALQTGNDDLLLFSLSFSTRSVGTSGLGFTPDTILGDGNGDPFLAELGSGSIEVTQSAVPEPGTLLLLGTGLIALLCRGRKKDL
jgi:hypothetical protein